MATKTNTGLVTYAKAQLGLPYWYATFGNTATLSLLDYKTKQYPNMWNPKRINTAKTKHIGMRVHDCVGLIKGYLWSETLTSTPKYNSAQDVSANGMYQRCTEKGSISTLPEAPGVLVFMDGHVGVYIGSGYVIEARGFEYGVVKTKLSERPWKNWGKCPFITYEKVTSAKPTTTTAPKPSATSTETTKTFKAKDTVKLNKTPLYVSSIASVKSTTKTGTFYVWSSEVVKDRIRITTKTSYCGKAGKVTGWVNVSDITGITKTTVNYFKACTYKGTSFVDALKSIGVSTTIAYRTKIAKANGITLYLLLPNQNTKLLNLLKKGKLIKP